MKPPPPRRIVKSMRLLVRQVVCAFVACLSLTAAGAGDNDPQEIMRRSLQADHRNEELRRNYTYKVMTVIHDLDSAGQVQATHSTLAEVLPIGGRPYTHVLEKDGKPLPPEEARKAQQRLDSAVQERNRLSAEQREVQEEKSNARRAKERGEMQHITEAFDFRLLGESVVNGRPAWQIQATPRRDYKGPNAFLFRNVAGTLWIDRQDHQWVKLEADALDTISIGFFLVRIARGTHISFENIRVNGELWAPKHVSLRGSARVAIFKKLNADQEETFSDYRKFQTDSRLVSTEDIR
jgi:hypothetical protein